MPNKVYIIRRTTGIDHEYSTYNECAFFDKNKAEAEKSRLEKKIAVYDKLCEKGREFDEKYKEEHPLEGLEERLVRKKWPAGLRMDEVTPEMRAERDRIEKHNKEVDERNLEREYQYHEQFCVVVRKYLLAEGFDPELIECGVQSYFMNWDRSTYSIEELDVQDAE